MTNSDITGSAEAIEHAVTMLKASGMDRDKQAINVLQAILAQHVDRTPVASTGLLTEEIDLACFG